MSDHKGVPYTGGCLCGAVRYSFEGDPLLTAVCHCTHCQKHSGGAFSVVAVIPASAYVQTGDTNIFKDIGDSGKAVERHFCGQCGSPIISVAEAFTGLTIVKVGTLDQASRLTPTQEAYCGSAMAWMPALNGTERFEASNI